MQWEGGELCLKYLNAGTNWKLTMKKVQNELESLPDIFEANNIVVTDEELKDAARSAFERLCGIGKKITRDWIIVGSDMIRGQIECASDGRSYPQWCIDNGYDWRNLGTKGKGMIYSAPWLARNPAAVARVAEEFKNLSSPTHIQHEYNKLLKEDKAENVLNQRNQMALDALDIPASDRWRVFHESIETFKPDKQYDWIITDPPYPKEYLPLFGTLSKKAQEWLSPGGLMVVMSGQMYFQEVMKQMEGDYYWLAAYLTPGQPTPLRHVNVNTTWKPLIFYAPNGEYKGKIFGDVFRSEGNDKDHHKWGQSESGMMDIISKICLPGQSILDPFMGAGTTGAAALKHGCLFDGVDILHENCEISKVRLHDATS